MIRSRPQGSFPRVWGQDLFPPICNRLRRIIPTHVGTSTDNYVKAANLKDHPHACGDKHLFCLTSFFKSGIIPTRVGTRNMQKTLYPELQDHPHACGDKTSGYFLSVTDVGSSPRVWGQVGFLSISIIGTRIIPTRVGTRCL